MAWQSEMGTAPQPDLVEGLDLGGKGADRVLKPHSGPWPRDLVWIEGLIWPLVATSAVTGRGEPAAQRGRWRPQTWPCLHSSEGEQAWVEKVTIQVLSVPSLGTGE
jgi:hypothetical protein